MRNKEEKKSKIPPHDIDAERRVLGGILLDPVSMGTVEDILLPEDFYIPFHKVVYEGMLYLHKIHTPISTITLADWGKSRNYTTQFPTFISSLVDLEESTPSVAFFSTHVDIVKKKSTVRKVLDVAVSIEEMAYGASVGEVEDFLEEAEGRILTATKSTLSSLGNPVQLGILTFVEKLQKIVENPQVVTGIPSGFGDLDKITLGFQRGDFIVLAARPSMGKALSLDSLLLTASGWITMREVQIGDKIYGEDGKLHNVTGVFPQGKKKLYEVIFHDGGKVKCCGDHLWKLKNRYDRLHRREGRVITLHDVKKDIKRGRRKFWSVPYAQPIQFPQRNIYLHPYVLGVYLGDGSSTHNVKIHNPEEDIMKKVASLLPPEDTVEKHEHATCPTWIIKRREKSQYVTSTKYYLRDMFLEGKGSSEKFIPQKYLFSSVEDRIALLQGLIDTDGFVVGGGWIEYSTTSLQLAEDIQFLVGSLGGRCSFRREGKVGTYKKNGKHIQCQVFYRLTMAFFNEIIPVSSQKHLNKYSPSRNRVRERFIEEVREVGEEECQCITIDNPTHLYITNDFIPTHNSALAMQMAFQAASIQKRAGFISLEMSEDSLIERLVSMESRVSGEKIKTGNIGESEVERIIQASSRIGEVPLFISDAYIANVRELRRRVRRLVREKELDILFIDYIQLIRGGEKNREEEVASISASCKQLAKELKIPIIGLAQLNRLLEQRQDKRPLPSDLRESGCLSGDTKIFLPHSSSYIPIMNIKEGDVVLSLNENSLKLEEKRVLRVWNNGKKKVFTLYTGLGRKIKATANHKFLTQEGWLALENITPLHYIALPRELPFTDIVSYEENRLAFLAHLIGNGCMLDTHAIQCTVGSREMGEVVENLALTSFEGLLNPRINKERNWYQVFFPPREHLTWGKKHPIKEWLIHKGLWNKKSYEKFIPPFVFSLHKKAIAFFLQHLWSTDGSINMGKQPRITYATSSPQLGEDVQNLLLQLGIISCLREIPQMKGRVQYINDISGKENIVKFLDLIGGLKESHKKAEETIREFYRNRKSNPNKDIIPLSLALPYYTKGRKGNFSREKMQKDHPLCTLSTSGIYWDRIINIEEGSEEEVWDLTIEGNSNFIANGIIPHNSLEQDADVILFIYRDEVYRSNDSSNAGIAEILISKHRNGPTGIIKLAFQKEFVRFAPYVSF